MKHPKWPVKLLKAIILIVSLVVIIHKLREYYLQTEENLQQFAIAEHVPAILLVFVLMGLNWFLEAIKWKKLLHNIEPISLRDAITGIFLGITAGLLTPKRLGEIGGRSLLLKGKNQLKGVSAFGMGSLIQTTITILFGILAGASLMISFTSNAIANFHLLMFIASGMLILCVLTIFNLPLIMNWLRRIDRKRKLKELFNSLQEYRKTQIFRLLGIGVLRYLTFSVQFYVLITLFAPSVGTIEAFTGIGMTYFIMTFLPLSSLVELGVRGSVAVFVFSIFTIHTGGVILATFGIWCINLGIPALTGAILLLFLKNSRFEISSIKNRHLQKLSIKQLRQNTTNKSSLWQ